MTKVLLFDGDERFAAQVDRHLGGGGFELAVVDDASEGLELASTDPPDVILLSVELPRINGFAVCNMIRSSPALRDTPLILMSEDCGEEVFERHRRLRARADEYVHKPIDGAQIKALILQVLSVPSGTRESEAGGPLASDEVDSRNVEVDEAFQLDDDDLEDALSEHPRLVLPEDDEDIDSFTRDSFTDLFAQLNVDQGAEPELVPPDASASASDLQVLELEPPELVLPSTTEAARPVVARSDAASAENESADAVQEPGATLPAIPPETEPALPTPAVESPSPALASPVSSATPEATSVSIPGRPTAGLADGEPRVPFESKLRSLEEQNSLLAAENRCLAGEIEQANALADQVASSTGGSTREILELRGTLNSKERELLGLREKHSEQQKALCKERDQSIATERANAELSSKITEMEKQVAILERGLSSAKADKELATKRGDDYQRKAERLAGELKAAREAVAEVRVEHERTLAHLRSEHEAGVAQAHEELERARSEARQQQAEASLAHEQQVASLEAEAAERLDTRERQLKQQLGDALAEAVQRHHDSMLVVQAESEAELIRLQEQLSAAAAEQRAVEEALANAREGLGAERAERLDGQERDRVSLNRAKAAIVEAQAQLEEMESRRR